MIDFSWATATLIFFTYVFIDILYALYIIYVEKRYAFRAAFLSAVLYGLLAFGIVSFSKNIWYLVPLASGAFIGTYITIKYNGKKL